MSGRYCGSNPPAKVTAQGTSLYIKLVSDESDTGPGFKASWTSKHLGGNTGRNAIHSLHVDCVCFSFICHTIKLCDSNYIFEQK